MKLILILFCILTITVPVMAQQLPPQLPASFYGTINAPIGSIIVAKINGITKGQTNIVEWQNKTIYSLDVSDGLEGAEILFYIDDIQVGDATWHSGTNTELNLFYELTKLSENIPVRIFLPVIIN